MRMIMIAATLLSLTGTVAHCQETGPNLPIAVGVFEQQFHQPYTTELGLPDNDVTRVSIDAGGVLTAITVNGAAVLDGERWRHATNAVPPSATLGEDQLEGLRGLAGPDIDVRAVAEHEGEIVVAADAGLYAMQGGEWRMLLARDGSERWAPVDVRAVGFDASGRLWFAAPQGVGCRVSKDEWDLYTGADGLPYNDFTCMAAGPDAVWFGTTNGAMFCRDGSWSFRQGRRWLLDNHVRDMAVDAKGNAWIATSAGVSCIASKQMTLADKAAFYEEEIEKHHRRTSLGFVNPANLERPGQKGTAAPSFTDNDGHNTGLYLGAVSLGYAATGNPRLKEYADKAFRALAFLSEVTQGGTHPAPEGFVARAVKPTSEPDPNPDFDLDYDIRRNKADSLWKIIQPRWPVDESGEWYWKNDSSSDELDGHFFGYAFYFDNVCKTETEKDEVRKVVRRVIDHVINHGYNMVDYDGLPTRWGHFSPDDLNRNPAWFCERGLNSLGILSYLSVAHHITGDQKYRDEYLKLAVEHGYAMNGMTQPKDMTGPGSFGQPDDMMAFMHYYHLVRYETDPNLLGMFLHAVRRHWSIEQYERNSLENFIYAACCLGKVRVDQWGEEDVSPPLSCFEDAVDTLKRYPLDLIEWPMSNAHRIDMVPLQGHLGQNPGTGHRVGGYVFPIDENPEIYWDRDPWVLSRDSNGTHLREGFHYLLAYYMGLAHGFIRE